MSHYNSYDSFNQKRRREKKMCAKNKEVKLVSDFVVDRASEYGVVVEVKYHDVFVYYDNQVVLARLRKDLNVACNQILYPGDKVVLHLENNQSVITNLIRRTSLLSRIKKDSTRLDDVGKVRVLLLMLILPLLLLLLMNHHFIRNLLIAI